MNRIRILDASVAGRIAAGEVVTSPASVVKELVENAIDAGSGAITVETKDGGKTYIRVTDNGSGIHPEDVLLSVQKHATSKIFDFDDMKNISSLGFRGEALSSIAAVSRLTIKTRAAGEIEGAVLKQAPDGFHVVPAGLPDGTTVTVENIFYNVPARYKFLKSAQAESAAITDLMTRLVLSRPEISFKYISNGTLQFQSPGTGELMDSVVTIYGRDISGRLFPVRSISEKMKVTGYISNPNYLLKSSKNQTILINGRYVRSKSITEALTHAYGERILKAHYPFAILDIHLPFSDVDVNVHPSKTTVMIQNEAELLTALDRAVKNALNATFLSEFEIHEQKEINSASLKENENVYRSSFTDTEPGDDFENIFEYREDTFSKSKMDLREQAFSSSVVDKSTPSGQIFNEEKASRAQKESNKEEQQKISSIDEWIEYKLIGQLFDTYILIQSGSSIYIIDQHAAHERINYERLKKREKLLPQRLMFPFVQNLSSADHNLLLENIQQLNDLGFEMEDFGQSTIRITALPQKADQDDVIDLLEDVIEILKNSHSADFTILKDKIIRHACRISVKGGDPLSDQEMRELVFELVSSKTVPICPHGRPVAVVLTKDELEKGFKRKV